ncbi:MAG: type IX secretion system membrane protein PorP/SprF [Crocinitomicaceae bacterium]|nr:type IX secretion system membrane protein PorP/SprF [Crocinitomicaceae bacterium]
MKKVLIIIAICFIAPKVFGQQQYLFTNYLMNEFYYNPALAGSKNVHYANLGYRNQWTGFDGSPTTLHANYFGSYANEMKHGYGASILSDRSGLMQNTSFYLNYAYHLNITDSIRIGIGVKPGFFQHNIKLYDAQLADAGDEILTGNILATNAFDINTGFHVYSDKFFVSMSMRNLLSDAIKFTGFNEGLSRHFTMIGGYNFINKKKKYVISPTLLLQYVKPAVPQASIMVKGTFQDKYWVGLTYRTQDAPGISLGIKLWNRLTIGYAYDYSLGGINNYNFGSHELMLSFITTNNKPTLDEEDEDLNNSIFDDNSGKKKKN